MARPRSTHKPMRTPSIQARLGGQPTRHDLERYWAIPLIPGISTSAAFDKTPRELAHCGAGPHVRRGTHRIAQGRRRGGRLRSVASIHSRLLTVLPRLQVPGGHVGNGLGATKGPPVVETTEVVAALLITWVMLERVGEAEESVSPRYFAVMVWVPTVLQVTSYLLDLGKDISSRCSAGRHRRARLRTSPAPTADCGCGLRAAGCGLRAMFQPMCAAHDEREFDEAFDQLVTSLSEAPRATCSPPDQA